MGSMQIRPFAVTDTEAVVELWHQVGITRSWNDPYRDIDRKMTVQPELFLVGIHEEVVMASAMSGFDGSSNLAGHLSGNGCSGPPVLTGAGPSYAAGLVGGVAEAESVTALVFR